MMRIVALGIALIALGPASTVALDPAKGFHQYRLSSWTDEDRTSVLHPEGPLAWVAGLSE